MVISISVFQPIGDAASELREIIPAIDHTVAVSVLRESESSPGHPTWVGAYSITFTQPGGWAVTSIRAPYKETNSRNYRLTPSEYARYLIERDPLYEGLTWPADEGIFAVQRQLAALREHTGKPSIDGTHASVMYDACGFYWVRTSVPIPWV